MNIKRGLFRIWVLLTGAYVLAVLAIGVPNLVKEFGQAAQQQEAITGKSNGYPVKCSEARGLENFDWVRTAPWLRDNQDICWYNIEALHKNFPSLPGTPEALLSLTYERADLYLPRPQPWLTLFGGLAWIIGLPLFFLAIGSAIYWALAGFARSSQPNP